MVGNPGRGKTYIAYDIYLKACQTGKSVLFKNASSLSKKLTEAKNEYQLAKLEKKIQKVDLLFLI